LTLHRGQYVHDLRHRYSVELRPDEALDTAIRSVALGLEQIELVPAGASTQPRFQPHLTIGRASAVSRDVADAVADAVTAAGIDASLVSTGTFGHGRIIYTELAAADVPLAARAALVAHADGALLDPLMSEREWIPHITIAYAVPEATQAAALECVRAALPLGGTFGTVEVWDLDVRPTQLVHQVQLPHR
jgi:2'-5' RNA ligase